MRSLMNPQGIRSTKRFAALIARVIPLVRVNFKMFTKVASLREIALADIAVMVFNAVVEVLMLLE